MAQRKAHEVDAFVRRPDPACRIILVYGPNAGLVAERARELARGAVDDPEDPFQLIRLDGDEVAGDPLRLADEANTIGLFGGKRSLWVRVGARNLAPAVAPLLVAPPADAVVVLQAGDLTPRHPLRQAVEANPRAMALPCYADEARDLAGFVESLLREHGLGIERDARDALVATLGADRALNRQEVEKVALYAHGDRTVTLDHVEAIAASSAVSAVDGVVDAAFAGEGLALDIGLRAVVAEGEDPGMVVAAALRHAMVLHRARLGMDRGGSADAALQQARIFFKRKASVQRQLQLWSTENLEDAIGLLREAQASTRRQARLGEAHLARTLLQIASRARRR
ncbi:DNA polymerase III subunit delta [Alsobacter sp. R-9]